MIRISAFLIALGIASAPAAAATYSATLASPADGRLVGRDIVWSCGAAACQGATQESRPAVLCQSLAKRAGRVEAFLVDGRAFTASELERCNASAKSEPNKALAQQ
jgi:hypothetical protein